MGRATYDRPMTARRVGLLGGTFDPPHIGHLVTAIDVREQLGLDLVRMVVANEPWQKAGRRDVSAPADRLAMVAAAVADVPGVEADDREIRRGGPSYTVDTLTEWRAEFPDDEVHLVVGTDAAASLPTWHRAADLPGLCRVAVVGRPGHRPEPLPGVDALHLDVPRLEVSSSELRARVREGRSLRFLVNDAVIVLIGELGLYGGRG